MGNIHYYTYINNVTAAILVTRTSHATCFGCPTLLVRRPLVQRSTTRHLFRCWSGTQPTPSGLNGHEKTEVLVNF